MNLYEFSQVNNNEMGVYIDKETDAALYKDVYDEVQRLIRISDELIVTVEKATPKKKDESKKPEKGKDGKGFCIRTGVPIPFNIEKPLSLEAYKKWNEYGDPDYPEKYCHFSGELSNGSTSVKQPVLKKNWKKAKELHNL